MVLGAGDPELLHNRSSQSIFCCAPHSAVRSGMWPQVGCPIAPVSALEGPPEAPQCVVAPERLSGPREQTAWHGGCAGRHCPLLTRRCSGGDGRDQAGLPAGGLTLARSPLCRLSPRTMLNVLLLCCGLLQGIQAILTTDLGRGHLQKVSGGLEGTDRARYSSLLRKVKEVSAEPAGESCGPSS